MADVKSKIVQLLEDVYPFGCKGDVKKFTQDELTKLEGVAKSHNLKNAYEEVVADAKSAATTVEQDAKTAVSDAKAATK